MRTIDVLNEYEQIHRIIIYLYAEESRSIIVTNAAGARVQLIADDDGHILARIGDSEEFSNYESMLNLDAWRGIIEQLSAQPPEFKFGKIKSRMEEIDLSARVTTTLNKKRPETSKLQAPGSRSYSGYNGMEAGPDTWM